jgi:hypothetical protein
MQPTNIAGQQWGGFAGFNFTHTTAHLAAKQIGTARLFCCVWNEQVTRAKSSNRQAVRLQFARNAA